MAVKMTYGEKPVVRDNLLDVTIQDLLLILVQCQQRKCETQGMGGCLTKTGHWSR